MSLGAGAYVVAVERRVSSARPKEEVDFQQLIYGSGKEEKQQRLTLQAPKTAPEPTDYPRPSPETERPCPKCGSDGLTWKVLDNWHEVITDDFTAGDCGLVCNSCGEVISKRIRPEPFWWHWSRGSVPWPVRSRSAMDSADSSQLDEGSNGRAQQDHARLFCNS